MRYSIFYNLFFALLLIVTSAVYAGPDYELMLAHSINRWAENLDSLRNEDIKSDAGIIYLCREDENAHGLANEFSGDSKNIEKGEWLGYTFKVSVRVAIPQIEANTIPWLRRQFYLGVAYQCDMDGLQKVKQNGL